MKSEVRLVAERVSMVKAEIVRLETKFDDRFDEVVGMLKLSHEDLDRRLTVVESKVL